MFNIRFIIVLASLCALISAGQAIADTEVSGEVSGQWEPQNSPYILTGTCTVLEDDTLTILPGVEVIFLDTDSLYVIGHLIAEGTEEDSISFHGDYEQEEVGIIMIWETEQIEFTYCSFRNMFRINVAYTPLRFENCLIHSTVLNTQNDEFVMLNCMVMEDIRAAAESATIQICEFLETDNQVSLHISGSQNAFSDNTFLQGNVSVVLVGGSVVILSNSGTDSSHVGLNVSAGDGVCLNNETNNITFHASNSGVLRNNTSQNNIHMTSCSNVEVTDNECYGTLAMDSCDNCQIRNNSFTNGLIVESECSELTITNNDFSGAEHGVVWCRFNTATDVEVSNNRFGTSPQVDNCQRLEFLGNEWSEEYSGFHYLNCSREILFMDNILRCELDLQCDTTLTFINNQFEQSVDFRSSEDISMSNNTFMVEYTGVSWWSSEDTEFRFTDNLVYCWEHSNNIGLNINGGNVEIKNNIFVSDGADFIGIKRSRGNDCAIDAGYNCFFHTIQEYPPEFEELYEGDIICDPCLFRDADGMMQLRPDSPCIDAGDPDSDADPDDTRNDIGSMYFDQNRDNPPVIITNGLQFTEWGKRWEFEISAVDDIDVTEIWIDDLPDWIVQLPSRDEVDTLIQVEAIEIPDSIDHFQFIAFARDSRDQVTSQTIVVEATGHTIIFGEISGLLRAEDSPYFLPAELYVPPDEELTIEPGCTFYFRAVDRDLGLLPYDPYRIYIAGKLTAVGTVEDSIIFVSASDTPQYEDWHGLFFNHCADTSRLDYVRISNASVGITANNTILDIHNSHLSDEKWMCNFDSSEISFTDCELIAGNYRINNQYGINGKYSTLKMFNCHVEDLGGIGANNIEMSENVFVNSYVNGGIVRDFPGTIIFERNLLLMGALYANYVTQCDVWNNTIIRGDWGLGLIGIDTCYIVNNLIYDSERVDICCIQLDEDSTKYYVAHNRFETIDVRPGSGIPDFFRNTDIEPMFVGGYPFSYELRPYSDLVDYGIDVGLPYYGEAPDVGCFEYNPNPSYAKYQEILPQEFTVYSAYPNPFNSSALLRYYLPNPGKVVIRVYDLNGRAVLGEVIEMPEAGFRQFTIDGETLSSGVYFAQIRLAAKSYTQRLVLMK